MPYIYIFLSSWLKKIFIWWKYSTLEYFSPASEIDLKQRLPCGTGRATSYSYPVSSCIQLMCFQRDDFCLMTHVVTRPMGFENILYDWAVYLEGSGCHQSFTSVMHYVTLRISCVLDLFFLFFYSGDNINQ